MSLRDKFEIDLDELPQSFETSFGDEAFTMQLDYNEIGDFYTVSIWDGQDNLLVSGEKLVYGRRLWRSYANSALPAVDLVPLDESGVANVCNKETFGKTVFLYVDTVIDETEPLASDEDNDDDEGGGADD